MTMSYTNLQPTELACGRTGTERVGTEGKGALPIAIAPSWQPPASETWPRRVVGD